MSEPRVAPIEAAPARRFRANLIAVHSVQVSAEEISCFAARLLGRPLPVFISSSQRDSRRWQRCEGDQRLGTDGAASNNRSNCSEMRDRRAARQAVSRDAEAIAAHAALARRDARRRAALGSPPPRLDRAGQGADSLPSA